MNGQPGTVAKDLLLQADELAAGAAAATPGAPTPPPGAPAAPTSSPAPGAIDYQLEARELWQIVALLRHRYPSLEAVYTDAVIERLGAAWAPILERHQLDLGKFTIYFVAATATAPIAGDTIAAIRRDRLAKASAPSSPPTPNAAPAAAAPQPAPAPGAPDPTKQPTGAPPDPFAGRAV